MTLPVTLLTGFLGAGKTTLLNHLLSGDHGLRLAIIVNDFGAINIDERLIESVEGNTVALSNGCICCDRRANLRLTLQDLLDRPAPPEYVVVEASGIADPLALAAAFRTPELRERARLDGVITVVDAANACDPRLDAQLVRDQLVAADIVLLNKIDLVAERRRAGLREWITSVNHQARVLETTRCRVPVPALLGLQSERSARLGMGQVHDRAHEFSSWSYVAGAPFDLHRLIAALKSLPPSIFRAKGIIRLSDAPGLRIALHLVGRRIDTEILGRWDTDDPRTELVLIAVGAAPDRGEIDKVLDACLASSAENVHRPRRHQNHDQH